MRMLLKDGVRYLAHSYKDEDELERMVFEHSETIFGKDSVLFPKRKVKAPSGIGTVPDGFLLLLGTEEWYILEVELASHPLHEHIVSQLSKFISVVGDPNVRNRLVQSFYEEIQDNAELKHKFASKGYSTELHKFLSDVISRDPKLIIVIDEGKKELEGVCRTLFSLQPTALIFQTHVRERVGLEVHIHSFDALKAAEIEELRPKPTTQQKKQLIISPEPPERYKKRKEFWQQLLAKSKEKTQLHAKISAGQFHWIGTGAGKRGLTYNYTITKSSGSVELYIDRGKNSERTNKQIFDTLYAKKSEIESYFGESLDWERLEGKRACRISWTCREAGLRDRNKWGYLQDKMIDAMIRLEKALRNHITGLDI